MSEKFPEEIEHPFEIGQYVIVPEKYLQLENELNEDGSVNRYSDRGSKWKVQDFGRIDDRIPRVMVMSDRGSSIQVPLVELIEENK